MTGGLIPSRNTPICGGAVMPETPGWLRKKNTVPKDTMDADLARAFDPLITEEEKKSIIDRCIGDPLFFFNLATRYHRLKRK